MVIGFFLDVFIVYCLYYLLSILEADPPKKDNIEACWFKTLIFSILFKKHKKSLMFYCYFIYN